MEDVNGTRKVFIKKQQEQHGMALLEIVLLVALVAIIALAGIYVKNRNSSKGSTQASSSSVSYKKATTNQGTVTAIEASINGAAADESQAEQQSENSQAGVAKTDSSDANNFGDSVNENTIGF